MQHFDGKDRVIRLKGWLVNKAIGSKIGVLMKCIPYKRTAAYAT